MPPPLLSESELAEALDGLDGWRLDGDRITSEWRFADFATAFSFMTAIAIHADRMGHHPEWSNVYNRVVIELTTHDSGGLTASDIELAAIITAAAGRAGGEWSV